MDSQKVTSTSELVERQKSMQYQIGTVQESLNDYFTAMRRNEPFFYIDQNVANFEQNISNVLTRLSVMLKSWPAFYDQRPVPILRRKREFSSISEQKEQKEQK